LRLVSIADFARLIQRYVTAMACAIL